MSYNIELKNVLKKILEVIFLNPNNIIFNKKQ